MLFLKLTQTLLSLIKIFVTKLLKQLITINIFIKNGKKRVKKNPVLIKKVISLTFKSL